MMFGLLILSGSLVFMTRFDLQINFQTVALARLIQGAGLAFLFVPINTVAYSYLPPDKNNAASGLINLARNVGASMGISFVTTDARPPPAISSGSSVGAPQSRQSAGAGDAAWHDDGARRA